MERQLLAYFEGQFILAVASRFSQAITAILSEDALLLMNMDTGDCNTCLKERNERSVDRHRHHRFCP